MPRVPCRKFTLADIMILVGATAGGLALARPVLENQRGLQWWVYPMAGGTPILIAGTVALVALRLRGPRPPIRRLFRQPGAAAGLASLAVIAAWASFLAAVGLILGASRALDLVAYSALLVGPAVAGAWLPPLITRSARPERGWLDRSGIALGFAWIALLLVVFCEMITDN